MEQHKQSVPQTAVSQAAAGLSPEKVERLRAMFGGDPEFTNLRLIESLFIPLIDGTGPIGSTADMRLIINPRDNDAAVAAQTRMVVGLMLAIQGGLAQIRSIVSTPVETADQKASRRKADSTY
jgi:hypothetical protein